VYRDFAVNLWFQKFYERQFNEFVHLRGLKNEVRPPIAQAQKGNHFVSAWWDVQTGEFSWPLHFFRLYSDLLPGFPQGGVEKVTVLRFHLSSGECDLSAVDTGIGRSSNECAANAIVHRV
jgi:hypothetical protein